MREMLFRGKRKGSNFWIQGDMVHKNDCYYIYIAGIPREVEPETVGQYTGLTDKNGTRIFEGDILEGDLEDNLDPSAKWRSVVVWGKFGWNCKEGHVSLPIDEFDIKEGEVIGNIHDNPEMMEVNDG